MLSDTFSNLNNFTQKTGTWSVSSNEALVTSSTSTITLLAADNTYTSTCTLVVKIATSTIAGVVWNATTSFSSYHAAVIDIPNNQIHIYTVSTGTVSTSSISFTGTFLASTFYSMRVESSGEASYVEIDGVRQTDVSGLSFSVGVTGLLAQNNTTQNRYSNFQANVNTLFFTDSMVTTCIAVAEAFLERKTQFKFSTNLASVELYDWFDQEKQEMPYTLSRSFNTLPTFYRLQSFGDSNNTMKLKHWPVYSTVTLAENEAGDAATPNWVSKTQANQTTDGDFLVYENTGVIVFTDKFPRNGHQNIRVTYSYGASTGVPEDVAQLTTRYAIRELLIGYGAGMDGLENMKRDNEMMIERMEGLYPPATLLACVGKTTERIT